MHRLIIHMDVNKTIIMSDPAARIIPERMLNGILCDSVLGKYDECKNAGRKISDWQPYDSIPSKFPPQEGQITFIKYLDEILGLSQWSHRKKHYYTFSEPGCVGHSCRFSFNKMLDALKLPESFDRKKLTSSYLGNGLYHILPSFFEMIKYLCINQINFYIIFRTFGIDIQNVIDEYNIFCEGEHPFFPLPDGLHLNGSNGSIDRRIQPVMQNLSMTRFDPYDSTHYPRRGRKRGRHSNDALNANSPLKPKGELIMRERFTLDYTEYENCKGAENQEQGVQRQVVGADAIWSQLMTWMEGGHRALALSEDWSYWAAHGESDDSGKLLLIDKCTEDITIFQVFFDDNIEFDRPHIVDVRDRESFEPLPFADTDRRILRRVAPFEAITDNLYFVKEIEEVMRARGIIH